MDIGDFKKTKWSEETSILGLNLPWLAYLWTYRDPDTKATIYVDFGGNEVSPVLDVDSRDGHLG
nr:hypothetical protein [uncultured Porphyromonas sp.]